MKKLYLPVALCLLMSLFLFGQSHAQFKVVGYFPSWSGSVSSIQFSKLTHVNYSFLLPNYNGTFKPLDNPSKLQSLVSAAKANNVKVLIAVGGWNIGEGGGNDGGFETMAANASYRNAFVTNLINFVNQYNLDGVDMDWEYPDPGASANNFATLMQQLSTELKARGKLLTAAVVANGYTGGGVLSSVFNYVDFLNIMAYDANDFQHSTYDYAVQSLNYWVGRGLPKSKAILGVPFYGRPSWESFAQLVARGANPNADVFGNVGYNGIPTIKNKTNLAHDQGGGIMIWEISQDATGSNSLLSAIHEVVLARKGTNPPPPPSRSPYGGTARNIPGKIEAEHYDNGGQGVAYNDLTAGNSGGALRNDAVDIEACTDAGGGHNVGWIAAGEWLEYTVNVTATGTYKMEFRVAAITSGKYFHAEMDGKNITGNITVPNTGGWQNWTTVTVNNISLTQGTRILRIFMDSPEFNINFVNVATAIVANNPPSVSISSPTNGQQFAAGANISIAANAADSDGSVSKVEFFVNGVKISEDLSSPYTASYSNSTAGTYSITARATDNAGAATTSAAVSISIISSTGTCSVAAWDPAKVYWGGDRASQNGKIYRAKWWTQGESPALYSGQWDVWEVVGSCTSAKMAAAGSTLNEDGLRTIEIYPNPSESNSVIRVNLQDAENARITLINSVGIIVKEFKGAENWIDLNDLEAGIYLVKVAVNGNEYVERLIKQ
jgi:GH18 family chitinase/chitodextrinase